VPIHTASRIDTELAVLFSPQKQLSSSYWDTVSKFCTGVSSLFWQQALFWVGLVKSESWSRIFVLVLDISLGLSIQKASLKYKSDYTHSCSRCFQQMHTTESHEQTLTMLYRVKTPPQLSLCSRTELCNWSSTDTYSGSSGHRSINRVFCADGIAPKLFGPIVPQHYGLVTQMT